MKERADKFYSIIRQAAIRDTPILFVEDPIFTHSRFPNQRMAKEVKNKK